MVNDIKGACRELIGFSKEKNKYGNKEVRVEYRLKPIDLDFLRKLFNVDLTSSPEVVDMIIPLDVNAKQAKALQKYVLNGEIIDLDKYDFELHCFQDPDYADYWNSKRNRD